MRRFWLGSLVLTMAACRDPGPVAGTAASASRIAVGSLGAGDLVITEIMADPAGSDNPKEWIEILNLAGDEVDLEGLTVNANGASFTVGTLIVPNGGYAVFGESADTGANGGYTPDYVYGTSTLSLPNGGTTISLLNGTTLVDAVTYGSDTTWPSEEGYALSLDDGSLDGTSNDTGANWCESYGTALGGTPGLANPDCALSDVDQDGYLSCEYAPGAGCDCDDFDATVNPAGTEDGTDLVDEDCDGFVADSPDTLVAGSLVLTEVLVNPTPTDDGQREWFEFRVDHPSAVDLFGLVVEGYVAGSMVDRESFTVDEHILASPGDYIVFGVQGDTAVNGNVQVDYDWPAPPNGFNLYNGSDLLELRTPSDVLIDGIAWDNGATFPDPEGSAIVLEPTASDHISNDDGTNWCVANVQWDPPDSDNGSPGQANQTCLDRDGDGQVGVQFGGGDCDDSDPAVNSLPGTLEVEDDGVDNDCDGYDAFFGAEHLAPGDIVITEIMKEPTALPSPGVGANGEWFELLNTRVSRVDLRGLDFTLLSSYTFTLDDAHVVLDPGERALFVRIDDPGVNGGLPAADYDTPSGWGFDNTADTLTLSYGGTTIDEVAYDSTTFPDVEGASLSLDPTLENAVDNDAGSSWCDAYDSYGTIPDNGTPGTANPTCIDRDVDGDTYPDADWATGPGPNDCDDRNTSVNPGIAEVDDDGVDQDCDGFDSNVLLDDLAVGDLLISEIMIQPGPLSNSDGEWFEIHNGSASGVDLKGLVIANDRGESNVIGDFAYVPAGGYALIVNWDDQTENGGLPYTYPTASPTRYHHELLGLSLYDGQTRLSIEAPGGTEFDAVEWDGGPDFPDPEGTAIQLDSTVFDATSNDLGVSWCPARDAYGTSGLYGTPAAANIPCTFTVDLTFDYVYNDPTPGDLTDDGPGDFSGTTTVTFSPDGSFVTGNFGTGAGGLDGNVTGQSLAWTYDSTGVQYVGSRGFNGGCFAGTMTIPPTMPSFWQYYTGTFTACEQ